MSYPYQLNIQIGPTIRANLINHQYSLGLRKTVTEGSSEVANVAFAVKPYNLIGATTNFKWDEIYQIAATTETFKQGDVISSSSTDVLSIAFQEGASIGENFNDFSVKTDMAAPPNGFHFTIHQKGPNASALVFMSTVAGIDNTATRVPAFISPISYVNGSQTSLIPVKKVKVFFEQKIQAGTMTTDSLTNSQDIDFTVDKQQTWLLNDQGVWKRVN